VIAMRTSAASRASGVSTCSMTSSSPSLCIARSYQE
jgi:hypothetical protein